MGLKERLGVLKVLKETPLQVIVGSDFMPLCDYLSSLSERGREIKKEEMCGQVARLISVHIFVYPKVGNLCVLVF